jgi:transposase
MRFYNGHHKYYCGIDLHTKTMYVCMLDQAGEVKYHRNLRTKRELLLETLASFHEDLVVMVECIYTWYWLADLCEDEAIPFVLGHALTIKAIHGAKTKNDRIDSLKLARLLRGGFIPMAYVYPRGMRSTRDLLRRRMHFVWKRAELLRHIQQTNQQYNLPKIGKTLKSKSNRVGVAEHVEAGSVRKSGEVDLKLIAGDDLIIRELEIAILRTAKGHDAITLQVLQTIPGLGDILSFVLLDEIHDIRRFPRVQDFVSYARLIRPTKTSAGKRTGTANGKIGNADLKWVFSEIVYLFVREAKHEVARYIQRLERKYGKDKAKGILTHRLGRTVYDMLKHKQVFDIKKFVNQESRKTETR